MDQQKQYKRIFAIPDVHGEARILDRAIRFLNQDLQFGPEDLLVVLGDYIDRGENSCGCIEKLKILSESPNVVVLAGNHEGFMIDVMVKGQFWKNEVWDMNGGWSTKNSYLYAGYSNTPHSHLEWLVKRPISFETQGFFFSHAPVPMENIRKSSKLPYDIRELTCTYYEDWYDTPDIGGLDSHPGPFDNNGAGDINLIGICGHIHRGPDTSVRTFPMYRFLDCGCGCYTESPLVIHECISNENWYVFDDLVSKDRFPQTIV